jgi:surfeit locus 1 family protein
VKTGAKFWLTTVAAVAGIIVTSALGQWQLSRAAQKEGLQAAIEAQSQREPVLNAELMVLPNALSSIHRSVKLRGQWLTDKTLYLDNRQMNAKPGFYVLTPLALDGTPATVLVQRGWVARNFVDRSQLPVITTPTGSIEIQGRIAPPPSKLYELGGPDAGVIRQNLDMAKFAQESGLTLPEFSVVQTDAASDGLLRDWPVAATSAQKNYGYAFQWFGLSALIFVLYVWFQIGKRFISKRSG